MKLSSSIRTFLGFVLHRSRVESEMEEELRSHLQFRTDELQSQGLSRPEAERQARVEFGGFERYKEECREALGSRFLGELIADVRFGWRQLRRNPGFAAVAVVTLALGIGANTAIFSLINTVMLKTLPIKDPGRLVMLRWKANKSPQLNGFSAYGGCPGDGSTAWTGCSFSYLTFQSVDQQRQVLSECFAATGLEQFVVIARGEADLATGQLASGEFFEALGVTAQRGRLFGPQDDQPARAPVAVVSYPFWLSRLGADASAVGGSIVVNGIPVTVIGVAAPQFRGIHPGIASDVWLPLSAARTVTPADRNFDDSFWGLQILGRLKPGISPEQARAALEVSLSSDRADRRHRS